MAFLLIDAVLQIQITHSRLQMPSQRNKYWMYANQHLSSFSQKKPQNPRLGSWWIRGTCWVALGNCRLIYKWQASSIFCQEVDMSLSEAKGKEVCSSAPDNVWHSWSMESLERKLLFQNAIYVLEYFEGQTTIRSCQNVNICTVPDHI